MSDENPRMIEWLLLAVALYVMCTMLRIVDFAPQLQTVLWKLGNLTVAAFIGYWIDRHVSRSRLTEESPWHDHIRRAIIVAGAMLSVSLGL